MRSWTLAMRGDAMPGEQEPAPDPEEETQGPVAVVRVYGPLRQRATWEVCGGMTDGYDAIEARWMAALAPGVTDLALIVDSPGGEVAGGVPAMRRMRAAADKAGVRVWTVADECATSMGYMLLCLGDKGRVHCPALGMTSSVGVVTMIKSYAAALEKDGVDVRVVRSGDRKCKPSGVEPIEPADVTAAQEMVDAYAASLGEWVAERRGLDAKDVMALEGAVKTGTEARAAGLVDGTMGAHEVLSMATAEAALTALREAMGLGADASTDQMTARAREGASAIAALSAAKDQAAKAETARLLQEEAAARTKAESDRAAARAAFVSEVTAASNAGLLSPAAVTRLVGSPGDAAKGIAPTPAYYDVHGESAARDTFAALKSPTPIVPIGARGGALPVPSAGTLTPEQAEHAKRIGVSEAEYAAHVVAPGGAS